MQAETRATVDWAKCSFFLALACVVLGWTQFKGPFVEIKWLSPTPVEQPTKHQDVPPPSPKNETIDWSRCYF